MRIKPLMLKIVAPALREHGFFFEILSGPNYIFFTENDSRVISFDTEKYWPKKLRAAYNVNGENSFRLELSDFDPNFCPVSAMTYHTQEELSDYLQEVTRSTISIILPYLDAMEKNYISSSMQMRKALAENTAERANRFEKKWGFTRELIKENLIRLDNIMDGMKTDVVHRAEDFIRHEDEIIDLTAYYGELIAVDEGMPGKWIWREINEGSEPQFVVEARGYDPLERVLHAWNFGTEAIGYSLRGYSS